MKKTAPTGQKPKGASGMAKSKKGTSNETSVSAAAAQAQHLGQQPAVAALPAAKATAGGPAKEPDALEKMLLNMKRAEAVSYSEAVELAASSGTPPADSARPNTDELDV